MNGKVIAGIAAAIVVLIVAVWAIDIEITEPGRLPDVKVDVDAGKLPKADVDTVDVDVGVKKEKVLVPDVRVTVEETTIPVPTINVDPPDAGKKGP